MPKNLRALVLAAAHGDKRAMMEMIQLFSVQINAYGRKLCGEDTEQDMKLFLLCFIRRYAKRLARMNDKAMLSYISRSLRQYSIRLRTDRDNSCIMRLDGEPGYAPSYEPDFASSLLLQAGLKTLTKKEKEVLFRLYYEGVTEQALAREHGISAQAIHKLKAKGLKKMRRYVKHGT